MLRGNSPSAHIGVQNWRTLHRAALLETNQDKLPSRIAAAQTALVLRAHELFEMSCEHGTEGEEIDNALYALRALSDCLKLKTREQDAA